MMQQTRALAYLFSLFAMLALAACGGQNEPQQSSSGSATARSEQGHAPKPKPVSHGSVKILAGSELKDLKPYFDRIERNTGVHLDMKYTGTLDGIEVLLSGAGDYDMAWFPNAKYLFLHKSAKSHVLAHEKVMLSPVVLGVKESKAKEFGWMGDAKVNWKDIADKVKEGKLRFAMTNPTASNSGFSSAIGVAAALSGQADVLRPQDIDDEKMRAFYQGQKLTAGSSGWLADAYVREQNRLDGIVNYESVLMGLNQSGELQEPLVLVYPQEGIVTADYPLLLLNEKSRDAYQALVKYFLEPEFQTLVMERTNRRPLNMAVPLSPAFPNALLVELPFPNKLETVEAILFGYLNEHRIPAHSYFVVDKSGSMVRSSGGLRRMDQLKQALMNLSGEDKSLTGRFSHFQKREKVTILPFSQSVGTDEEFDLTSNRDQGLQKIRELVYGLRPGGGTAIYEALERAYQLAIQAKKTDPDRIYSIVLLSDGANTSGPDIRAFHRFYQQLGEQVEGIRVFPVIFGEANDREMHDLAKLTGGRAFDANKDSLAVIFKKIRGYQ